MITINIKFFGFFKDFFHTQSCTVQVPEHATCSEVLTILVKDMDKKKQEYASYATFANDQEILLKTHVLKNGDNIALFPPVSGG